MRWLYTLVFFLLMPFVLLRLWWRGRANPGYRQRWAERFARLPALKTGGIWVHAVSVGETLAAVPLIKALQQRYPQLPITVTTTTPTGSERVKAAFGGSVQHVYGPYDLPWLVARFLRTVQPRLCLIMETELWPNLLAGCATARVPVVLVNARLSKRSARGYSKVGLLTRDMLQHLTLIAAQERSDARRFRRLGVSAAQVVVTGSIKTDVTVTDAQRALGASLREQLGAQRYVVIAASTHAGEDELVLDAFAQLRAKVQNAALILVPRHPERFDAVAALVQQRGFVTARRSRADVSAQTQVLVGDSMGELMGLYAAADVAFVGGSLVPTGGHNLLEPAALAIPILQGPHSFNFAMQTRRFRRAGALVEVSSAEQLAQCWQRWADPAIREFVGQKALAELNTLRGSLERVLVRIEGFLV
ncbi:3-deoxy-D-manno-octulosonic acid transferase [Permianibacter sp. IMCC34836]|uniref:lipid IV(A) 3-deoxy-D-manno-octulosonic acid transferase n=1 Tax=Permianibacter fluminis TaxID=2738515 RepID=UPI001557AF51|nr:lipid IV(A) 3-deoxy-D-manno-octulosonic acid transferase [Permianibacter fluminis]NQD36845.1 3-deoxy-D-manno-octulosonic acid transferase [Permianibacter fluminis]